MIAYFDNSATTKPCPEAVRAVTEAEQSELAAVLPRNVAQAVYEHFHQA